jgi:2-polyprenyl-6-methoxyphenol hydroxylase-like FAD-dependent oxidoreductase
MVLIGDACLNTCPIPGTGIGKVLVDVERLCAVHLPRWLAQPAIDRDTVGSFYADPVKVASDEASLAASFYARHLGTLTGLPWAMRRGRNFVGRHVIHAFQRAG